MSSIVEDVKNWNTPALGSYLLWRFTSGFTKNQSSGESPIMLLHFIATAILTNPRLAEPISDKRANLPSYVKSFSDKKKVDLLLSIQERIDAHKQYTLSAFDIGIRHGLIYLSPDDACVYPKEVLKRASRGCAINAEAKSLGNKAEILGKWFSEYDISQIATMLKVIL